MAWQTCDKCGKRTGHGRTWILKVCGATQWSPAEYELRCDRPSCRPPEERDEDYERAAARYGGSGKDWR